MKKTRTHQKLFSRVLAKNYFRDIKSNTMKFVEGQGFFRKEVDSALIEKLLPQFYCDSIKQQETLDTWNNQALCTHIGIFRIIRSS